MEPSEAANLAKEKFVSDDNYYGCAETTFVVLKHAYGESDPDDSAVAMALNGGIAYAGGTCGAISGAALALGQLAASRIDDHAVAKRVARKLTQQLMDEFHDRYGSTNCIDLTGADFRNEAEHDRFISEGTWRKTCTDQIQFAVARLADLAAPDAWELALADCGE